MQSMQEMPHGDFLLCFRALREEEVQEGDRGEVFFKDGHLEVFKDMFNI